jgi:deazaflavin-dependent oxidoreductase (nitroreductase family)
MPVGRIYVFAGNRGAPTNPGWYHNLVAHPDVTVELGTEKFEAKAIIVDSAEGDRLGSIQVQKIPALASLAARITRNVPVILLERKKERERTTEKVKALPLGFPHRVKGPAMSHSFLMREKLPFIW